MTETLVAVKPVIVVCRRGHWLEADPNGVECPFCGAWENLPEPICPNRECGALLEGITYRRDLGNNPPYMNLGGERRNA